MHCNSCAYFVSALRVDQLSSSAPRANFAGFQSKQLIIDAGLQLGDVDQYTRLDVCIDGADE